MTADFGLAGAPVGGNAWLHLPIIVKSVQLCWRVSSSRSAFEMLEPIASKGARWVLRRGEAVTSPSYPTSRRPSGTRLKQALGRAYPAFRQP